MGIRAEDRTDTGAAAMNEGREFLITFLVHCGDLSNPIAPTFKAAEQWAKLVWYELCNKT
jgi:hypothetical protein